MNQGGAGEVKGFHALGLMWSLTLVVGCSEINSLAESDEDDGAATIALTAESSAVIVNGATPINVRVSRKNGEPARDGTEVAVTARLGQVEPPSFRTHNGGTARVTYRAGAAAGTERLEAKSGDARGELTLTIQATTPSSPAPTPLSPPPQAPPPPPAPPMSSPIDLRAVTWLHTDVSGWAETSHITRASIGDPPICIHHTKAGQWPVRDDTEGNPWIFANIGGRWYAATYEWLRPGQVCKHISAGTLGPHTKQEPLASWRPRSGEVVGLMVSARARTRPDTVRERSNIVVIRWP
jgi:hypothetical protein